MQFPDGGLMHRMVDLGQGGVHVHGFDGFFPQFAFEYGPHLLVIPHHRSITAPDVKAQDRNTIAGMPDYVEFQIEDFIADEYFVVGFDEVVALSWKSILDGPFVVIFRMTCDLSDLLIKVAFRNHDVRTS